MDDRISDLLEIIRDEISLYRELIEHARRKTAILVRGRIEAILESSKAEESFNIKLRFLETEMARLCRDLSESLRIPREEFTLVKLADNLECSLALEIRAQATLFRNMVRQLKAVSQRNMTLIKKPPHHSREWTGFLSNMRVPNHRFRIP